MGNYNWLSVRAFLMKRTDKHSTPSHMFKMISQFLNCEHDKNNGDTREMGG